MSLKSAQATLYLKKKKEDSECLGYKSISLFFLSLPDVLLHTSRRNCFTRRLFSNYSEGGCAAASVSRRWKNRWGETEGPGEEGVGVSSCWHPSSDVGCRTASVGGSRRGWGGHQPMGEVLISWAAWVCRHLHSSTLVPSAVLLMRHTMVVEERKVKDKTTQRAELQLGMI